MGRPKEVVVAAFTFGPGRAQEGDIIAIRDPLGYIGNKEQAAFLWLIMDSDNLPDPATIRGDTSLGQPKNRYNIDITTLGINLVRARNPVDKYQPLVTVGLGNSMSSQIMRRPIYTDKI